MTNYKKTETGILLPRRAILTGLAAASGLALAGCNKTTNTVATQNTRDTKEEKRKKRQSIWIREKEESAAEYKKRVAEYWANRRKRKPKTKTSPKEKSGKLAKPAVKTSKKRSLLIVQDEAPNKGIWVTANDAKGFNYAMRDIRYGNIVATMDRKLHHQLDEVAAYFGADRAYVTSPYRTKRHNINIGGAENSYHVLAMAMDFGLFKRGKMISHRAVQKKIKSMARGGLGIYSSFTHMDSRSGFTTW